MYVSICMNVCNVFFIQKYHTLVIQILVKTAPSVKNSKVGNTIVSARQVPAVNTVKVRNRSRDVRFNSLYVKKVMRTKGLFTWSGGPRSSGVGFFCFHALRDTKQKKRTQLDRGPHSM